VQIHGSLSVILLAIYCKQLAHLVCFFRNSHHDSKTLKTLTANSEESQVLLNTWFSTLAIQPSIFLLHIFGIFWGALTATSGSHRHFYRSLPSASFVQIPAL
jgi:hypothetical protein